MSDTTAPALPNQNDAQSIIDLLKPFCEKSDGHRLHLKQPFVLDGWLCASDGYAFLALPAPAGADELLLPIPLPDYHEKKLRDVLVGIQKTEVPSRAFPKLKISKAPEQIPCEECRGKRGVSFHNEFNEYECECQTCEGSGGPTPPHLVSIENEAWSYRVFMLLRFSKLPITGWLETAGEHQLKGFLCTLPGDGFAFATAITPLPPARADVQEDESPVTNEDAENE